MIIFIMLVDEMLISLLDSGSHEIVFTACGVLINMMVDPEKRSLLKDEGGIKKYVFFAFCHSRNFTKFSNFSYLVFFIKT